MTPEALVLAEAFADDPLMTYFWPRVERRRRALPLFWESRVEARRRGGIVDTVSDGEGVVGVVLWELPGVASPMARPFSLIRALGAAAPRAVAASRRIEGLRPETPHLYLAVGGRLPRARGKGLVSELVAARLEASDTDIFVVATNPMSAALAQRLGFQPTNELVLDDGVIMKGMLRKA
ncbi:hypothetical protein [Nocardia sp. NPDC052566]|uniref:hypothetical protein n=1 Tax=Nocardia sp. NPDC052566 TaxID=3364330 RepID=UPI0037C530B2